MELNLHIGAQLQILGCRNTSAALEAVCLLSDKSLFFQCEKGKMISSSVPVDAAPVAQKCNHAPSQGRSFASELGSTLLNQLAYQCRGRLAARAEILRSRVVLHQTHQLSLPLACAWMKSKGIRNRTTA